MYVCIFVYSKKENMETECFSLRVESGGTPESVENYMLALEKRRDERVGYM